MTKYLLPFLLFVSVGLSQGKGVPKVDPVAKMLADILQGASRNHVEGDVFDPYHKSEPLDKALKDSLETKLKLGMKRNKLSLEVKNDAAKWSAIAIKVGKDTSGGRTIGYIWSVNIIRYVRTEDGKHKIESPAMWPVAGGKLGTTVDLKEEIDTALDKVFLAYLELKE